jgi:hypothetical protein
MLRRLAMIVLGLVLTLATGAAAAILIAQNGTSSVSVAAFDHQWSGHVYWIFVAGMTVALSGAVGLAIVHHGVRRLRRRRHEIAELLAERDRLSGDDAGLGLLQ